MEEGIGLVADADSHSTAADAEASFERFVLSHHAKLYGALCLVTGDRYEAEDVAQEAFVRILERWEHVRGVDDPTGYLFRTAMNVFRGRYRRAAVALRHAVSLMPRDADFEAIEARETVVAAMARLPVEQRAALVVTALLGYSSEDAAYILGTKPSTLRARATRARAALRQMIGEEP